MRLLPKASNGEMKLFMQLLNISARYVAQLHVFQMVPTPFVPRVQVRSVAWQRLDPYPAVRLSHEFLDRGPAVDWRTVPNHQQPRPGHMQQVLQKLDAVHPVERLLARQGVNFPFRGHSTHDRQMVMRLLLVNDRRLSCRSVGSDHSGQQVKSRFVLENQHTTLTSGAPEKFRPDLVSPALDGLFVTLDRSADGHLGRPAEFPKQTGNVPLVVADAKFLLDNFGNAGASPNLAPEAIGLGSMPKELRNQSLLRSSQLSRAARRGVSAQGVRACRAGDAEPLTDRRFRDSKGLCNRPLGPIILMHGQCSHPPPLLPVIIDGEFGSHIPFYGTKNLSALRNDQ